jgi:hypothetical protein
LPWDIITEKKDQTTQKVIHMLKVAIQFENKVFHDVVALKWFISLCEREVIQRIQGF